YFVDDAYVAGRVRSTATALPGLPTSPNPDSSSYRIPGWAVAGTLLGAAGASYARSPENFSITPSEITGELFKPHAWKQKVQIGEYLTTAVKLEEKLMKAESKAIQDDPIRRQTTERLSQDGSSVAWLDVKGVLEVGAKSGAKFPMQWVAQGDFGFSGEGLLSYRVVTPISAKLADDLSAHITAGSLVLPTTQSELLAMEPGAEFEIVGHAKLSGQGGLKAHATKIGEVLKSGVRAEAGASGTWQGNIKVRIKRLPGVGRLEVTVEQDTQQKTTLAASLQASLNYQEEALKKWGDDNLGAVATKQGEKKLKAWWSAHEKTALAFNNSNHHASNQLARFVVDTQSETGLNAYHSLLTLNLDHAEALSQGPGHFVESYRSTDNLSEYDSKTNFDVAGYKILLSRALEAERMKEVRRDGEVVELVRGHELSMTGGNFISGYENIKWGAVTAYDTQTKSETTFYNLLYSNEDRVTHDDEVDSLFRFAKALNVDYEHATRHEVDDSWNIFRWFTSDDNTQVDADLYFSQDGVEQVVRSSSDEARRAIFRGCAKFNPRLGGLENLSAQEFETALEYAGEYRDLQDAMSGEPGAIMVSDDYVSRQYTALTGRDLFVDIDALEAAQSFMLHKDSLAADASEDAQRRFFVELGRTHRFRFMPTILALTSLAGRENLMVNALGMHGDKIDLDAKSEGALV
ncbi:MAG: hypothetical protein HOK97_01110, partial [Deltaproteobacteria bacterium]|nr:hypothetical protein [Deltaproteobacteria bacterium]